MKRWRALAAGTLGALAMLAACGDDDNAPTAQLFATTDSGSDVLTPIPKADSSTAVDAGSDSSAADAGADAAINNAVWDRIIGKTPFANGDHVHLNSVASDATDRIFVAGYATSTTAGRPIDDGSGDAGADHARPFLLAAYDGDGAFAWDRFFSALSDQPIVATDRAGNVYLTAHVGEDADFGGGVLSAGQVVASYTRSGDFRFQLSLPKTVFAYALAASNDTVLVGGDVLGTAADLGGGARDPGPFVVALSSDTGAYRWDRTIASSLAQDAVRGIVVRADGNVSVGGNALDAGFFTTYGADGGSVTDLGVVGKVVTAARADEVDGGTVLGVFTDSVTSHVTKLDPDGGALWSVTKLIGDKEHVQNGGAFAVDPGGNVWAAPSADLSFATTELASDGGLVRELRAYPRSGVDASITDYRIQGMTILSNGDPVVVGSVESSGVAGWGYIARLHP